MSAESQKTGQLALLFVKTYKTIVFVYCEINCVTKKLHVKKVYIKTRQEIKSRLKNFSVSLANICDMARAVV